MGDSGRLLLFLLLALYFLCLVAYRDRLRVGEREKLRLTLRVLLRLLLFRCLCRRE